MRRERGGLSVERISTAIYSRYRARSVNESQTKKKSGETVFLPVKAGLLQCQSNPPSPSLPVSTDLMIFRRKHILVKNGLHLSFRCLYSVYIWCVVGVLPH